VTDPVLLSRINGEDAQGESGRHISVRVAGEPAADIVRLPHGEYGEHGEGCGQGSGGKGERVRTAAKAA